MHPPRPLILCILLAVPTGGPAAEAVPLARLRSSVLLHAGFDHNVDADYAAGDRKLYTAATGNRSQARPGLPDGELVRQARGEGRFGHALYFTRRMRPAVFYQGERNLGYQTNGWSGAVSVWLRVDPDRDLEPGYCDPLQFVGQGWEMGNMFLEFSKDHAPRHFRYAIQPLKRSWNPGNRGWEDIPDRERPMVPITRPPFARDQWTHVVFCFGGVNSGRTDGFGRLYLNGREEGTFTNWALPFQWEERRSALTLGLSYVGWVDDLTVFNRPLTPTEVRSIHDGRPKPGVGDWLHPYSCPMRSPRSLHGPAAVIMAAMLASLQAADKPRPASAGLPRIATAQPVAVVAGSNAVLLLRGQHLTNATEVRIRPTGNSPGWTTTIRSRRKLDVGKNADALKLGDHQLEVTVALPAITAPLTNRVEVLSPAGASAPLPWVVLPARLVTPEQEPNGGFAQAQEIPAVRTLLGAIQDPADVDVFRVAARRGQGLVVHIWAAAGGSALDPVLTLHDARGRVLAMADDEGEQRDPVLRFLPASDGDYFLSVVDAYDRGGAPYGYLLRVETAP